ncbi:BON domain-containing protein [Paenacidovorax monticola]|uniref:BON domain-containing protein n=1 Tax=Paenacidovorax monticola TaxID=1926868 RepID=A0A7H0HIH2_9BURK|nr:BON domain-containing protein [Paenacidovorax monticola]QNP60338.1 BON domain-containing protein [Paenacidovorax monticola]
MNANRHTHRIVSFLAVSALAFGLAACGKKPEEQTVGQKLDAAVEKTEQAAADAQRKAQEAMQSTTAKVEEGASKAEATMQNAAQNAGDAAKQAADKALGAVDDAAITAQVAAGLAKDPDLSALKINVDTKAGVVTLSGPAPTAQAKDRAADIAKAVKGVSSVNNQLAVKAG